MHAEPGPEHLWLQKLAGKWESKFECQAVPGQPSQTLSGTEECRSLGGLWMVGEGTGETPGGGASQSIMTLGYDPEKKQFVGSFIASMMTHLWIYHGGFLDADQKVLTLLAEGPNFMEGGTASYKDVITLVDHDHRMLESHCLQADGSWQQFMSGHYYRVK